MKIYLFISFLFTLITNSYSQDSCRISVAVDYPHSDSKYWTDYTSITNPTFDKFYFLEKKKTLILPRGKYTFSLFSDFGDSFDTTITLDKEKMNIQLKIKGRYLFPAYSNELLETAGDTIIIDYERRFCAVFCRRDRDGIALYKTNNGQYHAHYFTAIIEGENCLDYTQHTWEDKLLEPEKTKFLQYYFTENNVSRKARVQTFRVKIDKRIFWMKYDSYVKFREQLLN